METEPETRAADQMCRSHLYAHTEAVQIAAICEADVQRSARTRRAGWFSRQRCRLAAKLGCTIAYRRGSERECATSEE